MVWIGMDALHERVAAKKAELSRLRIRAPGRLANLAHVHDPTLTCTAKAIEGNTLIAVRH